MEQRDGEEIVEPDEEYNIAWSSRLYLSSIKPANRASRANWRLFVIAAKLSAQNGKTFWQRAHLYGTQNRRAFMYGTPPEDMLEPDNS